ncbi:MAG TPA: hypothetical protein VN372_04775 [Methanospirillum sp.]|nr:hypothetical protein [Methanospirillum sp.]
MAAGDRYQDVLSSLQLLFRAGTVIEIRALGEDGTASGYFDDLQEAARQLLIIDADPRISGIYVTLNEVRPDLLARRANRIKYRLSKKDATTADADIITRRWLPIDIDPKRPSGISSSDPEHADALVRAESIATFLSGRGWPDPIIADSGNGAHLLYRIDIPNDEESRDLIKAVLRSLDIRFSDSRCTVDLANFNAGRIWKVYGTQSRKGDNFPLRPHRRSRILSVPDACTVVSADLLTSLAGLFPEDPPDNPLPGAEKGIDLCAWLSSHGLSSTAKPYQGGMLYVLDTCPFSDAHTDGAFAIQFANGAIFAGCHHDSCGSGVQRWPELRQRFSGPGRDIGARLARLQSDRIREKRDAERCGYPPQVASKALDPLIAPAEEHGSGSGGSGDDVSAHAREILNLKDPLSFMLDTFARSHEGDRVVAECLIHSLASRSVINSKGLHVSITGESGKGKSHAIETMQSLVPEEFRLEGRISDKALFYQENLHPGTVITLDDVSMSEQMQEILKGVTTSFQKPFPYRTVNKDRKAQICIIPERCVWWVAKVEGSGDDQIFNRMLTCWIDDSEEQDMRVLDRTLRGAAEIPSSPQSADHEVLVCQELWRELSPVFVTIPYARRIRFQSAENRRNPDMLLDLIRTHAALRQRQRGIVHKNGIDGVIATEDDFHQASRLFMALNGETGGQGTKLTRREAALIAAFESLGMSEVTIPQLQRATGWSNSTINKLLHGYRSYGESYSGLLEKCPAVAYLDRTISTGDEGCTTLRRMKVYLWDPGLYDAWTKGGLVWLADDPDDHHSTPPDPSGKPDPDGGEEGDEGGELSVTSVMLDSSDLRSPLSDDCVVPVPIPDPNPVSLVPDDGLCPEDPGMNLRACSGDTGGDPPAVSLSSINPHEFIVIDGWPDTRRCSVCGKKPTHYQERMTRKRQAESPRLNLMLCRSCYDRAVSRHVASLIPLPGVIDTGPMIRVSSSIGRCHLCDIRPAIWSDPGTGMHLCETCYDRELVHHHGDPGSGTGIEPGGISGSDSREGGLPDESGEVR